MGTTVAQRGLANKRTDDPVIREALVRTRLRPFRQNKEALVLHELGLAHGRVRVDVAVLNGVLHGYEIKSDSDSLNRLEIQIEVYRQALQKLTLVVAERHASNVFDFAPDWCGVLLVSSSRAFRATSATIIFNIKGLKRFQAGFPPARSGHVIIT